MEEMRYKQYGNEECEYYNTHAYGVTNFENDIKILFETIHFHLSFLLFLQCSTKAFLIFYRSFFSMSPSSVVLSIVPLNLN